ncbi:MAG: polysaccharide deacetylase family protein [Rhodomicrobium sp.]
MYSQLAAAAVLTCLALPSTAQAELCHGRTDALGTSRTIVLEPSQQRRLGLMDHGETLPLADHEVVLTFDDGPIPRYTPMVLDALAAECVKANFFLVGQMAETYPALVQREYREGHAIGTHTQHHRDLNRLSEEAATKEITDGIASVNKSLGGPVAAPFFRFPYLDQKPAKDAIALRLGLTVWSADFQDYDWHRISPGQVAAKALTALERYKKGILLLHDIHKRTALALPLILSELKRRGYRVVHVVPADAANPKTAARPRQGTATN